MFQPQLQLKALAQNDALEEREVHVVTAGPLNGLRFKFPKAPDGIPKAQGLSHDAIV